MRINVSTRRSTGRFSVKSVGSGVEEMGVSNGGMSSARVARAKSPGSSRKIRCIASCRELTIVEIVLLSG